MAAPADVMFARLQGHIPIGDDACYVSYSQRYSLILDRFKNTVAAQIFGHTHSDSFKVYYDAASLTGEVFPATATCNECELCSQPLSEL
jgi:hypothetical protein